ncbi:type II toxin-antitoxin system HipA family toxin [Herbaspirillum seropedicae]|uniref:HipA domain-containing protein n=1 Tax=Herbaspirillum seropedicae TaxID=964 RepID=UPI00111DD1CF|nr:HipA domain-containing protein [Herbaspirillum seropedicae]QDD63555.1 type II toxin-antitoxin system HipA family toxin [Herbaspirillum seropedicae]
MNRELDVYLDERLIGKLFENSGVWSFQYDQDWLRTGHELSPGLPLTTSLHEDGGTVRPVQWFFDNLLPEEAARLELLAFMRKDTAQVVDAWSMLEHFGAESAGAITLLRPGSTTPASTLLPLSATELEARIRAMPRRPLSATSPKKMSLAGAQQKMAIVVQDGQLFEPTGNQASTHILKPDVLSAHYPCSAVNEWFSARLAQAMGLPVPKVELRYLPSPVYIIERFDRKIEADRVQRLHTLDAAQLLTLSATAKYAHSGVQALLDILDKCRTPATARIALFRWTLFNILIGNSDAHLKNLSLYASSEGYELAPHYDLLSIGAWARPELLGPGEAGWPDIAMAFAVGQARHYSELTVAHLQAFGRQLGIGSTSFRRELTRMIDGIEPASLALQEEFAERNDVPAPLRASQLRMLGCIHHLPIKTMVRQLRRPLSGA